MFLAIFRKTLNISSNKPTSIFYEITHRDFFQYFSLGRYEWRKTGYANVWFSNDRYVVACFADGNLPVNMLWRNMVRLCDFDLFALCHIVSQRKRSCLPWAWVSHLTRCIIQACSSLSFRLYMSTINKSSTPPVKVIFFHSSLGFKCPSRPSVLKAAKYEIQKPSTWHATLFRCKFWSMFPVFHLA